MSDLLAELSRHRQEHQPETGASVCACGDWEGPFTMLPADDPRSYAAHLAERVKKTDRLDVEVFERTGEPSTCTLRQDGEIVFDGISRDALLVEPEVVNKARAEGRVAALSETADKWQWGAWSDGPRCPHLIAHGQYATDWLRERLARERAAAEAFS